MMLAAQKENQKNRRFLPTVLLCNHYSAKKTSGSLRVEFFPAKALPAIAYIGP